MEYIENVDVSSREVREFYAAGTAHSDIITVLHIYHCILKKSMCTPAGERRMATGI